MADKTIEDLSAEVQKLRTTIESVATTGNPLVPVGNAAGVPGSGPPAAQHRTLGPVDALSQLDERIACSDPTDALKYSYVREHIVRQRDFADDRAHLRKMETRQLDVRVGLSVLAISTGVGLVVGGFGLPAYVCLGAGLYGLAPGFIDSVTNRIFGGRNAK